MGSTATLKDAFVEDHRTLTRGLSRLVALVEKEDYAAASRLARELDEAAGPHIEFEESSFYPEVRKSRGADYVKELYDEHRSGLEAIRMLQALGTGDALSTDEQEEALYHLRRALDHAVSCGTLLSHVTSLPDEEQRGFLAELERFRRAGHKWTELHPETTEG